MTDRVTRFDADLFDAALTEGRRENRSGRQQLEHWARIGQMISANETATRRRITAAIRGELPISALNADERLVTNVELDVAIRERAARATFGHGLLKAGLAAVGLDEQGALVEFRSDGSRQPIDANSRATQPIAAG